MSFLTLNGRTRAQYAMFPPAKDDFGRILATYVSLGSIGQKQIERGLNVGRDCILLYKLTGAITLAVR